VPFLLDLFRIPADTFQLFLATGVINSRFGALLAAVHTVAVALLGSAAIVGALRFDPARVLRYLVLTIVLSAATIGGLRMLFNTALKPTFARVGVFADRLPFAFLNGERQLVGFDVRWPSSSSATLVSRSNSSTWKI
jgi:hypothetical protein